MHGEQDFIVCFALFHPVLELRCSSSYFVLVLFFPDWYANNVLGVKLFEHAVKPRCFPKTPVSEYDCFWRELKQARKDWLKPRPVSFTNLYHGKGDWYANLATAKTDHKKAERAGSAGSISAVTVNKLSHFLTLKLSIQLLSIAEERNVCFINANPPAVSAELFQGELGRFSRRLRESSQATRL